MSLNKEKALAQFLAAYGVSTPKRIPRELASRVLTEALNSMAGDVSFSDEDGKPRVQLQQAPSNTFNIAAALIGENRIPEESELRNLADFLADEDE